MYGMGLKDVVQEFLRFKSGLFGLFLLFIIVGMAVGAPIISSEEAGYRWYDIEYWTGLDLPKGVPPEWVGLLTGTSYSPTERYVIEPEKNRYGFYEFNTTYNYEYDIPPTNIIIRIEGNISRRYLITIDLIRPDGNLIERVVDKQTNNPNYRLSLKADDGARSRILSFARTFETEENINIVFGGGLEKVVDIIEIMFLKAEEGIMLEKSPRLNGEYIFSFTIYTTDPQDTIDKITFIVNGASYGVFGTDALGRDIFVGIVWGARVALVLGLVVAIVSVLIGVVYGTVSAYVGGWTDEILQRIQEFVISIPLLPLLLILAYTFQPTIWNLILLLIVFSWPGPVKTIRSMALQIREQLYITAAKAIGASTSRIVLRYILPQILPYTFALVAFSVPGAILTEAGVSFLLGAQGTLEITWGRILSDAERYSAVLTGMWWWVIPPGIMIAISGLAFVFIGTALDRVLNPRLLR